MNFISSNHRYNEKLMKSGDLVIIYLSHNSLDYIILSPDHILDNKFGSFHHNDFIGKYFGSKVYSKSGSGWIYALEPTPELWSEAMNTRTQIVDDSDASYVTFCLDVFPGCTVVESGTGSGNMSLSLARAVAPNGHVNSYEYNARRAEEATKEFATLGVSDLITVRCKDVCAPPRPEHSAESSTEYGGFDGVAACSADAVFLDLPEPWKAVRYAKDVLKPGRSLCSYSPCIEQVMKTCDALRAEEFYSIRMVELRRRPFDARVVQMEVPDLGQPDDTQTDGSTSGEQKEESDKMGTDALNEANSSTEMSEGENEKVTSDGEMSRRKRDVETAGLENDGVNSTKKEGAEESGEQVEDRRRRNKYVVRQFPPIPTSVARPIPSMKGHTAYLTFAVRPSLSEENTAKPNVEHVQSAASTTHADNVDSSRGSSASEGVTNSKSSKA